MSAKLRRAPRELAEDDERVWSVGLGWIQGAENPRKLRRSLGENGDEPSKLGEALGRDNENAKSFTRGIFETIKREMAIDELILRQ